MDRADPVHIVLWKQRIYSGNSRSTRSINSPPAKASPSPTAVGAETNSIFLQGTQLTRSDTASNSSANRIPFSEGAIVNILVKFFGRIIFQWHILTCLQVFPWKY